MREKGGEKKGEGEDISKVQPRPITFCLQDNPPRHSHFTPTSVAYTISLLSLHEDSRMVHLLLWDDWSVKCVFPDSSQAQCSSANTECCHSLCVYGAAKSFRFIKDAKKIKPQTIPPNKNLLPKTLGDRFRTTKGLLSKMKPNKCWVFTLDSCDSALTHTHTHSIWE